MCVCCSQQASHDNVVVSTVVFIIDEMRPYLEINKEARGYMDNMDRQRFSLPRDKHLMSQDKREDKTGDKLDSLFAATGLARATATRSSNTSP